MAIGNVSVCESCWFQKNGEREPVKVVGAPSEVCGYCHADTNDGIYVRVKRCIKGIVGGLPCVMADGHDNGCTAVIYNTPEDQWP